MILIPTKKQRGFTLIELLVVMAVMSILVGVGVNTFSIAQKKARDSKRKADIRTIRTALEAYYLNNGYYPMPAGYKVQGSSGAGTACTSNCASSSSTSGFIPGITPNYLAALPTDPINTGGAAYAYDKGYEYTYHVESPPSGAPGAATYSLMAQLEDAQDLQACKNQSPHYTFGSGGSSDWCPATPPAGSGIDAVGAAKVFVVNQGN